MRDTLLNNSIQPSSYFNSYSYCSTLFVNATVVNNNSNKRIARRHTNKSWEMGEIRISTVSQSLVLPLAYSMKRRRRKLRSAQISDGISNAIAVVVDVVARRAVPVESSFFLLCPISVRAFRQHWDSWVWVWVRVESKSMNMHNQWVTLSFQSVQWPNGLHFWSRLGGWLPRRWRRRRQTSKRTRFLWLYKHRRTHNARVGLIQ